MPAAMIAVFSLLLAFAPNYVADSEAGPLRRLVRGGAVAGARVAAAPVRLLARSRANRGLPAVFPAARAAAVGSGSCGGQAAVDQIGEVGGSCVTLADGTQACGVAAAPSFNQRFSFGWANYLDGQVGHSAGRGPLRRALNASPEQQRRIIERFNSNVGSRHGFQAGTIADIIQWIADHPDQVMAVIKLIVSIIGMFGT